ncbi:MAG: NADH:ubiquinone oxidoreductase [Synergistetes bacterium]|nr:NADH:ubiquinone oxidoreductase [Synergistota bacterium]
MSWTEHAPILIIAAPLLVSFAIPLLEKIDYRVRNAAAVLSLAFSVWMVLIVLHKIWGSGPVVYVFGAKSAFLPLPSGFKFPVRIMLEIDNMSAFMALSGSIAAMVGVIYSWAFVREEEGGLGKYYSLFLLMAVGMLGMELTGDAFNFFVFLEIASIASFGLIAYRREDPASIEASFKYMIVSTIGAIFVLVAIGFLYGRYDALNMAYIAKHMRIGIVERIAFVLLMVSLAMKAGAVPMHMWVSDAYGRAPAAVTATLVSVSQASLYGLFRVMFSMFGVTMNNHFGGWMLIIFGLLSMFIGVTMAIVQKDIKRLMAYHAISQTGYMLLGVGVGLAVLDNPVALRSYGLAAMTGGIFHIMNHAMYKGLLFLTAGAIFYRLRTFNLNEMGGLARKMKYTTIYFIIGAAAIAGLPPFNGFASKLMIYESVYKFNPLLSVVAMVVSILTLASFVKVFHSAFLGPEISKTRDVREVPKSMVIGMGIMAVICILFGLFPGMVVKYLAGPAAVSLANQTGYISSVIGGGM